MDIIKTKSGKMAIRVYDKNGIKQLYSLRKIAVTGISAVTLAATLLAAPYITKEIKYSIDMEQIQDLRTAADEIEELGSKANIEIKGENYFIPEEIREYATIKENLTNSEYNSDEDNTKKYEEMLKQEKKDIYEISKQVIKDTVAPTFENPEAGEIQLKVNSTPDGNIYTASQTNTYGYVEENKIIDGKIPHYTFGNDDSTQQLIEILPEAIESGEEIKVK